MIEETLLRVHINGQPRIILSCSPHDPLVLVTGHLLADGWVRDVSHIIETGAAPGHVHVTLPAEAVHACDTARAALLDGNGSGPPFLHRRMTEHGPAEPAELLRSLFAAVDEHAPEGGVHGAAASDGSTLSHVSYDVARHCCVDRVIGARALHGTGRQTSGLVTTARISAAMATKAARAGFRWIVTRGLGTSLAHEVAAQAGMLVIERAGRGARQ